MEVFFPIHLTFIIQTAKNNIHIFQVLVIYASEGRDT